MNPQEAGFYGNSVELSSDQEPYLDLGALNPIQHLVLTGVTSYLQEAGIADIIVEAIPSIDEQLMYSLRWSPESPKETRDDPIGTLLAGVYIARGAFENTSNRGDQRVYQKSLEESVEWQVGEFREHPEVFRSFTSVLEDEKTIGESDEVDASGYAIESLVTSITITKETESAGKNESLTTYELQQYPSVALFLTDIHRDYKGISGLLVSSDSDIAHERFFESAVKNFGSLLRPNNDASAYETATEIYLDPLVELAESGSDIAKDYARAYILDLYRNFWDPHDGQFEGRLPEDVDFRRFVYHGRKEILSLFSTGEGIDYYRELGEYFEQRGLTGEGRLVLLQILTQIDGPLESNRQALLNNFIEECFRYDENYTETLWDYVTNKSLLPRDAGIRIPNGVIEAMIRRMQRMQNEQTDEESNQEVMTTNILHTEQLLECLSYYSPDANEHARRFLSRLTRGEDFPIEVRETALRMKQSRKID